MSGGVLGVSDIGKNYAKKTPNEKPPGWFEALKKETGTFLRGENTSTWALFAEIIIGVIPVAGQLIDGRDIIKAIMELKDNPTNTTLWFLLIAALIGLIPGFGDAVKGAIKAIKIGGKSPADLFAFIRKYGTGNAEQALKQALDVSKLKNLLNRILTPKFLNSLSKAQKQKIIQIQVYFDRYANQIIKDIDSWAKMTPTTASVNHAGTGQALGNKPATMSSTSNRASGERVSHNQSHTTRVARKGVMKKHTPKCFKPGDSLQQKMNKSPKDKANIEKEYYRQLKDQEAGINSLTVEEYLAGREAYKKSGRPSSSGAQKNARERYETEINQSLINSYEKQGKSPREAERLAEQRTKVIMSELNALHNPDMVAGGRDQITRLGRADVNKSIGGHWPTRVDAMDKAAKEALQSQGALTKMNVELNRCK